MKNRKKDKTDKLNRNSIALIGTDLINNTLYLFLNTFMIAHFFSLTDYDFRLIAVYYIVIYIFICLSSILLGNIVKTKNKLAVFRIRDSITLLICINNCFVTGQYTILLYIFRSVLWYSSRNILVS